MKEIKKEVSTWQEQLQSILVSNLGDRDRPFIYHEDTIDEIKDFIRKLLSLNTREIREQDIKAVLNSRTINEEYGVGVAEDTARIQAIVDIKLLDNLEK